jgi:hypothetical protein
MRPQVGTTTETRIALLAVVRVLAGMLGSGG